MAEDADRFDGVFVVIAAYNETEVIGPVLDEVARQVAADRIIVVDDASGDDTAARARAKGASVLRHLINRGQGAALATGIAHALAHGAAVIVTFDADGQHNADDLPAMIEPIVSGEADIVLGSRFLGPKQDMPPLRRIMLRIGTVITRLLSNIAVTDTHNGFRAFSAHAARTIRIGQDRMAHASEILDQIARHRLRFVERPVRVRYSDYSMSKGQRNRDAVKILARVILDKVMH